MTRRNFQPWEKDFILLSYPTFKNKEIASILDRTKKSIDMHGKRNKLRKLPKIFIGDVFGRLTVIDLCEHRTKKMSKIWRCECKCGNIYESEASRLTSGHNRGCGCKKLTNMGYENIEHYWYKRVKWNAKKRNIKFEVSKEQLQELLEYQEFKCCLTGLPIEISPRTNSKVNPKNTASLDRIDSDKTYTIDNVQFLHKHVNYMKWTLQQDYFIKLCRKVVKHNVKPRKQYTKTGNKEG